MNRRTLLKLLGGIAALPALGKAIKGTGIKSVKTAGKVLPNVEGMPEWFTPLVNKIMKEGVDVSPAVKRVEDMTTVKKLEIPSETGSPEVITLTENKITGQITIDANVSGGVADSPFELNYRPPKSDINLETGKEIKYPGDFSVIENRPRPTREPGDYEFDYDNFDIDSAYSDVEKLEKIATGKIKDVKKIEQRAAGRKKVEDNPYDDIMDRYPDPDPSNYRADGGLASFANGGKAKKKKLTEDSSEEELKQIYEEKVTELAGEKAPPGLLFDTEKGQGVMNLFFGPKIRQDKYPGVNIKDPRIGLYYSPNYESETAPRLDFTIGPKGGSLGFTKRFADGGLTKTVPPAMGPDSQGVESLFRRRYS